MEATIVNKPAFRVIGKMGQGPANQGPQWIKPLWEEANGKFNEISGLVKFDGTGRPEGIWGLMSDISGRFKRWETEGKYLAGCEVKEDAEAPAQWTLWEIPSQTYAVVSCRQEDFGEAFHFITHEFLPGKGYQLAGAVHEYYPADAGEGMLQLYFPICR